MKKVVVGSSILLIIFLMLFSCINTKITSDDRVQISGIYPHLAYYNSQGECGTGAVVPWANRLWVITYSPHYPYGSDDKLYEITPDLKQIVRKESIGGTPANRMIHQESQQLFIGPYAIDSNRNVKAIPYEKMQGRLTGNARHLIDPAGKIYFASMEEGFYEVDVHTKEPTILYNDGNNANANSAIHNATDVNPENATIAGAHGKGLYSGQGVLIYSNNGEATEEALHKFDVEAGALAEWNGKEWKVARRNQFVEVTGPGGIYGNQHPETDPIWATGWDHKSLLLGVRNMATGWDFYRLPKASHSYDGAHGWNTEWPRIRDIGTAKTPDYLMTMHGMFWRFPKAFTAKNSLGVRPRSSYLKVIGDFARWNDQLVFGCDDSAQKEFLNKRKQKGGIEGPGQSNSNLWFTSMDKPDQLGATTASGAVWLSESIVANQPSEPFLFAGWSHRSAWLLNEGTNTVEFILELDELGNQNWKQLKALTLGPGQAEFFEFSKEDSGEWIRVIPKSDTKATLNFNYTNRKKYSNTSAEMFNGLTTIGYTKTMGGLLYGLGNNRRALGIAVKNFENGTVTETGYYELDSTLNLVAKEDEATNLFINEKFAIPTNVVEIDASSVLIIDDKNRRWRLPLGDKAYKKLTDQAFSRICREVATERDLLNCSGTFYELPAENADGFAKIRPIASHNFAIHDYASYRGMLVMTGIRPEAEAREHIVQSEDGKAAVWVGAIDDLWEMGKPIGQGGPWKNTAVKAGLPSDPYLIGHYDQRSLEISHKSKQAIIFYIEVEPIGHGPWMPYMEVTLEPGEAFKHEFSQNFHTRWIRFVSNKDCEATAWLVYE